MNGLVERLRAAAINADSGNEISESFYHDVLQAAALIEAHAGKAGRYGLVWHRADWDLPATRVETWEEDGSVYDVLLSDPVLICDNLGEMYIALYAEDSDTGFRGWVDPHDGAAIHGVTHWRQLPDPPGGAT